MRALLWLLLAAIAGGFAYWLVHGVRRFREKREAQAARAAAFLAQAVALTARKANASAAEEAPGAGAASSQALAQQKLLLEAAAKAGEAGEPVLAMQLYARLIARDPASALAVQARAAIEAQKKRLGTAQSSP